MDRVRPARKFLESNRTFPRPETISQARSFFGMINQVSYSFFMSPIMEPLRHLLRPDTWTGGFHWTPELNRTIELAKEEMIRSVREGHKHFDI